VGGRDLFSHLDTMQERAVRAWKEVTTRQLLKMLPKA
jgi:hypothetical protein